jgi:hypothetical protein
MNTAKTIFASAALAFAASSFAQTAALLSPVGEPEASKVISVVTSIPLAVDLAAYNLAEKAFAPKVTIDYTSLWGGQPNAMTPAELMTAWRGIVPGFDATWHELSNVKATVNGSKATATAFVDGRHWLSGQLQLGSGEDERPMESHAHAVFYDARNRQPRSGYQSDGSGQSQKRS